MNQENKFGEYREKLLQYWAVFLAACGKLWENVKIKTKSLLQKLAGWLLKAREWLLKVTANLRSKGKAALDCLAVWLAGIREKIRPVPQRIKRWCESKAARLKGGNAEKAVEALPSAEEPETDMAAVAMPAGEASVAEAAAEEAVRQRTERVPAWADNPYLRKAAVIFAAIGKGIKFVLKWLWKLRKVFMAVPVIWAAVKVAMENMERLPEQVGLDIQSTGEFARMITREEAVYWPLGITLFCLLLMFCSKKPILPWVISIFTLVLPGLIWILNYYA